MLEWIWNLLISPYTALDSLIRNGGITVFWILVASVVMWTIIAERYWYYKHVLPREAEALLRQWRARRDHKSWFAHQIRRKMISQLKAGMVAYMPVLRVTVPLCPLLGLVGTVAGMLEVFDAMAARGSADARAMASGVSQAMICTMTGLAVSITGLYPVYYFQSRQRHETEHLADQFEY